MARSDNNLKAVLEDTANAIRSKTGGSSLIVPRDFADTIGTIPVGEDIIPYYTNTVVNAVVPSSITTNLKSYMFNNNEYLQSVNFNNATIVPSHFAYRCYQLTNITLNNSTTSIEESAFADCSKLTNLILPKTLSNIGAYAFDKVGSYYENGTNTFDFETNANVSVGIYNGAFRHSAIKKLKVEATIIREYAFNQCYSLEEVEIKGVGDICSLGNYAFNDCTNITNFKISGKFISIGGNVFYNLASYTYATANIEPFDFSNSTFTSLSGDVWNNCKFNGTILLPSTLSAIQGNFIGNWTIGNWTTYWLSVPSVSSASYLRDDVVGTFTIKYIFLYTLLETAKVATNWSNHLSQMLGYGTFQANDTLPTTQGTLTLTWYDSVDLTNQVSVASADGDYYCTFA